MKLYQHMLLAGLMALPAMDGLRHGDVWLCASFAAGAAFVLAANRLFGATDKFGAADKLGFGSRDAQNFTTIAIAHGVRTWPISTPRLSDASRVLEQATRICQAP